MTSRHGLTRLTVTITGMGFLLWTMSQIQAESSWLPSKHLCNDCTCGYILSDRSVLQFVEFMSGQDHWCLFFPSTLCSTFQHSAFRKQGIIEKVSNSLPAWFLTVLQPGCVVGRPIYFCWKRKQEGIIFKVSLLDSFDRQQLWADGMWKSGVHV